MIGKTILQYEILEKLGEGGMGVVYKAQDTKLDRLVALKFLPHHMTGSEQEKARLLQEAKSASALNHPNVCTIFDIKEEGDQQFIVMEYVDGTTLREKVTMGAGGVPNLSVKDVMSYAIQIGEALQDAHAKGIVHRDIKAENIMVNARNQIKVMDFGLAKLKGSLKLTRTSSTVGTLAYMAPEQIQGGEVDARSDIFSFGVVLFEMLTGRTPFRGEHEGAMVYSIVNEDPEPVEKYRPEVSPELVHVLNTALEKDPEDRYQTVSEMVRDLRRAQKQSAKLSRSYSTGSLAAHSASVAQAAPEAQPPSTIPTARVSTTPGSRKTVMIATGFLVVVALLYGAYELFLKGQQGEQTGASFQSMKITRLTSTGKTRVAAMSPDGKYVVYSQVDKGKQSLWVKQVATGSNVQIIQPSEIFYTGLTMSRDGNYIYYVARPQTSRNATAYQVPVLGGSSRVLIDDVMGPITISPDLKRLAFLRLYYNTGDFAIMIANMDGTGERKLASHKGDLWFEGGVAWSPDGGLVAAGLGSWEGGLHYNVVSVSVEDGREQKLSNYQWAETGSIEWLNDGSGLLLTAREKGSNAMQIWQVATPSGDAKRITNDLNDYTNVTLTGDSKTLSVVQSDIRSTLWIIPANDSRLATQMTAGKNDGLQGLSWTPDGRIVYTSSASGNVDLWVMNKDGSGQKQLTTDPARDYQPDVSPDGQRIAFVSERSGIPNIWTVDINGGRPKQITAGGEDYAPAVTADGKWILFQSWDTGPLLATRIPLDGGDPVPVTEKGSMNPVASPDGKTIAYVALGDQQEETRKLIVIPFQGGDPVLSVPFPSNANSTIRWTRDGKGISYINTLEGVANIWVQPLSGGSPAQVTRFTSDLMAFFDWSPDGKELAGGRGTVSTDVILISDFR
jgi:serine/threonine protein kinase/WD40 repeat protein